MIGRFLQGAGLGGLLGAALLATASLTSPPPPAGPHAGQPAPPATPLATALPDAALLGETAPDAPTPADTAPAPAAEPAGPAKDARPAADIALPQAAPVPPPLSQPDPGALVPDAADPGALAATPPPGPASPQAESAPATPDLPAPPPLTPEEERMLAEAPLPDQTPDQTPADTGSTTPETGGQVTLSPAPALSGAEGIATDRLPRIGDPAPAAELALTDASQPPVSAFARPFDNPAGKPALAIILIDTGEPGLDRSALAALPFPVTFALDPMAEGAADRAAIYRDGGQEVILLATALPRGAVPSDVEQAFQVMAQNLPEAVAVMDLPGRSFQSDRTLSGAVVPVLGAQGRGLVTWDEGLNAADQVARREDVPAAVIFRSLDAAGEPTPAIRRALDRAAFKAAQEGRVTVVGHTRPETVAALLEWTVEGRAATVALAPVTAVLTVD